MAIPDPDHDPQFYQGVALRRLIAFVLDTLVIIVLWFFVLIATFLISFLTLGIATPVMMVMLGFTGLLYRWFMLWQRSATLGMLATGIEVRDQNGEKCDTSTAFLHSLAFIVTLYVLPAAVIGWVLMASSPHGRAMHDMMVKTVVINRPA